MSNFKKIAELKPEDRSKVKDYWTPLWGKEFAEALTKDYTAEGDTKKVNANTKK